VLKNRETAEQLRSMNMTPVGGTPDEIRRFIKEETERWGEVIRSANIELQ
jgi:tripartite-type tricarboxylate transporter receptor subunit TctC